jgi:hypothetical protein
VELTRRAVQGKAFRKHTDELHWLSVYRALKSSQMRQLHCLPVKSGNKLPTAVQKVYLRLGKKVHEIWKNFIRSISLRKKALSPSHFGNPRA